MSERVGAGCRVAIALGFGLLAALPARAADPKPTGGGTETRVVKLLGTSTEFAGNVSTAYLYVAPADGGPPTKVVLNEEARRKMGSLYSERGKLITITVKTGSLGSDIVSSAVPFDGPKGLESPKAFVFDGMGEQKVGAQTFTTAKLSRLGQKREVLVPNRPIAGQKPGPDPVLVGRLKGYQQGDVIEIEIAPGPAKGTFNLLDVDVYREPLIGDFVKMDTIKEGTKSFPAVTLNVDDQPKTLALPAASPGAPLTPGAQAVLALAKKLKAGYSVRFVARDDVGRPTLREMRIDGEIQPTTDKHYNLLSTYVRISFSGSPPDVWVYFYPGSNRSSDQALEKGSWRVINSNNESNRLKFTAGQLAQLRTAYETRMDRQDVEVTPAERMQWSNAYNAWFNARDDAARGRFEQDMLWAAQEVSLRWKKEIESKYTIMRSIMTPEQLEEVMKLGRKGTNSSAD